MSEHDSGTETSAAGGVYSAMGFTSPEGDLVMASLCPLPVGFAKRMVNDVEGLGREVAGRVVAVGGELVESGPIMVNGWPAFYRIVGLPVRLASGEVPNGVYAVGLVVPLAIPPA